MNKQFQNLNQMILYTLDTYTDLTCFRVKYDGHYHNISYHRFRSLTFRMTNFLRSQGIGNGERVALSAENSLEWMVVHMACLLAGGTVVPLSRSLSPDSLLAVLQDSGARIVAVQGSRQYQVLKGAKSLLPGLKAILTVDTIEEDSPGSVHISSIISGTLTPEIESGIRERAQELLPHALALVHYTAGVTGEPKGAVFNQGQRLQAILQMDEWLTYDEDDLALTILSWGSAASLDFAIHLFVSGVTNILAENEQHVLENMQQTSPTLLQITPYIVDTFYREIMQEIDELPQSSQDVFNWALAISKEYLAAGPNASTELREGYERADMTFFSQLRARIGGRVRRIYVAKAALPQHLAGFVEAIGLIPLNVYSLTEAGGFPAVSWPETRRHSACGQIAPGFQISIADDGEVLVKGATVMGHYWQRSNETEQIINADGWLHTGDLGYLDEQGYLYLTGRKESAMILSTGHKIIPLNIEKVLMANPFIAQAVVFAEGRPYVSAFIVPELDALSGNFNKLSADADETAGDASIAAQDLIWYWLQENQDDPPMATPAGSDIKTRLDKAIKAVNSQLEPWEQVKKYSLLEQAYSQAANNLTAMIPAGRNLIIERYYDQIEAMYPQTLQIEGKTITEVQVSPERLRELLAKENLLDAWMADAGIEFLFELARQKQIDAPSMVHICDIAASIAQMEHEERPLSTAFIVGDQGPIARRLPPSQVELLRHDHIQRMRQMLISLAPMVDGLVLGYAIDSHGYVRGIHKLDVDLDEQPSSLLLGPQFRRHAAISGECDALVFFVPTGGKQVRVFANGELAGRYSNGDWSQESLFRVGEVITHLIEQKKYDLPLIRRILRCAFRMSEENLGAIFIIGDGDRILKHSDAPDISHFALIRSAGMDILNDDELINFAKQDGATVIDISGRFRGCMVLLRPGADTRADIGPGKGARHSSAAKMSTEAQCLAITVSQDGPITIYDSGERIMSL